MVQPDRAGRFSEALYPESPQVDGSGQYAEAISPAVSPPLSAASPIPRHTSPMSEMMENTPPIPVQMTHNGFLSPQDRAYAYNTQDYYSAPEVVENKPPRYRSPPVEYPGDKIGPSGNSSRGYYAEKEHPVSETTVVAAAAQKSQPRILGMKRKVFFIVLAAVVIAAGVGLGVGLGFGLKEKDKGNNIAALPYCKDNPEYCIGGNLDAKYYSKRGAFNGSGIALAGESWNAGSRQIFTLYFQHHSGDIRYMQYGTNQQWIGGNKSCTVATDAKNGTALSVVSYVLNSTSWIQFFYIGRDGYMKQMTQNNQTNTWEPGVLNAMNLKAYDSPMVGLQACWKGNYYGDPDVSKLTPGASANVTKTASASSINLWYASSENTFEQYSWINGNEKWTKLSPWLGKNGHAGVGCYSWDEASTSTYTMMVNQNNDTEIWWRDTNTNTTSTEDHPINSWVLGKESTIQGVYPTTSMGYTTFLYMQMADLTIKGFNVSYQSENTTIDDSQSFVLTDPAGPVKGLPGTHMTLTSYSYTDPVTKAVEWDGLFVFYQTEGDDITAFNRKISGGLWTKAPLTIPDG